MSSLWFLVTWAAAFAQMLRVGDSAHRCVVTLHDGPAAERDHLLILGRRCLLLGPIPPEFHRLMFG